VIYSALYFNLGAWNIVWSHQTLPVATGLDAHLTNITNEQAEKMNDSYSPMETVLKLPLSWSKEHYM